MRCISHSFAPRLHSCRVVRRPFTWKSRCVSWNAFSTSLCTPSPHWSHRSRILLMLSHDSFLSTFRINWAVRKPVLLQSRKQQRNKNNKIGERKSRNRSRFPVSRCFWRVREKSLYWIIVHLLALANQISQNEFYGMCKIDTHILTHTREFIACSSLRSMPA